MYIKLVKFLLVINNNICIKISNILIKVPTHCSGGDYHRSGNGKMKPVTIYRQPCRHRQDKILPAVCDDLKC